MLSLPGARTDEDDGHGGVANESIPYNLANCVRGKIVIIDISVADRLIYDVITHHLDETILVLLILMMETNECPVPRSLRLKHSYSPSTCSKLVKSSTPAIFANMRL